MSGPVAPRPYEPFADPTRSAPGISRLVLTPVSARAPILAVDSTGIRFHCPSGPTAPLASAYRLRFTIAANHRGRTDVVVCDLHGQELGRQLVWEGGQFQPFDVTLASLPDGDLTIRGEGTPLQILSDGDDWGPFVWSSPGVGDRVAAALELLSKPHCLQPFGWKDGCITDALLDLGQGDRGAPYLAALDRRISRYVPDGHLVYDYAGKPCIDTLLTIESGLPVAALMNRPGGERLPDILLRYWSETRTKADGTVTDGNHLSTEGCYTVGWPMAGIARMRKDRALAEQALLQLRVRRQHLRTADSVWQSRIAAADGQLAGWARGVAWYLLGHARTASAAAALVPVPDDIRAEIARTCAWVQSWQRSDGLWGNFIEDPATAVDASGSAGIAAGLAHAAALGYANDAARASAVRAYAGLGGMLGEDGWLAGCAQENKGGEVLQRSTYRVCAPFALGLFGQLHAALHESMFARPGAA